MTRTLRCAAFVASGLLFSAASAFAQPQTRPFPAQTPVGAPAQNFRAAAPQPAAAGTRISAQVAVIDLLHLFENHPSFQDQKAQMDRAKEMEEKKLIQMRDNLKAKAEKLKEFKPGTTEYGQLESELAQEDAKLQVEVKKANQKFITYEGKMYFSTYQQVLEDVEAYCSQRGIVLVLRYTGKQVNPDNPEDIMKEMNEQVIYYNQAVDITPDILAQIKSRHPARVGQPLPRPSAPVNR